MLETVLAALEALKSKETHYQQVNGVALMVKGLQYHFDNFISKVDIPNSDEWFHEVTAYINRLGQIYYFLKSDFMKVNDSEIVTILEAMPFRMKFSAHRHLDAPKPGDLLMDVTLPNIVPIKAREGELKIGEVKHGDFTKGIALAQCDSSGDRTDPHFFLEFEHPKILNELATVLSSKASGTVA